jgi:ADP-ribose pyrophosphatase
MQEEYWEVLGSKTVLEHPFLRVTMQQVRLPDGRTIADWPIVGTRDYVNVMALNEAGEAIVLEGYKHGLGRSSWQVPGGYLEESEEPLTAIQRELLEESGYASDDWLPLGSFVVDANRRGGIGHFFLARNAKSVARPIHNDLEGFAIKWVGIDELKQALFDGRIALMAHAVNVALGLWALEQHRE